MNDYTKGNLVRAAAVQSPSTIYSSQQSGKGAGMKLVISITGTPAGTLTATIEEKNMATNLWRAVLVSTALNAAGDTVLRVNPASVAAANLIAQEITPRDWRIKAVVASGNVTWGAYVTYGG